MPQPAPSSAPEQKPSQPPVDSPPKPAPRNPLFHTLLEAGFDPPIAYTAETQMNAMTSETVAAQVQPLVTELRQLRENMVTKADLAGFATKADLAGFATKADLAGFATKTDLSSLETRMTRWTFGALMAQAALIIAIIKLLP